MSLICVPPSRVSEVWPVVFPLIDAGYAAVDELTPPDLMEWLSSEKGLLWIAEQDGRIVAALTTSLERKRSGLVCRMVGCGGTEMNLWKDHHAQIEDYARSEGCVKVVSEGRPGWGRVLPGYRTTGLRLEKDL